MDGLSSFYPVAEGLDYLVNSDNEVALFEFINLHSYQEYQCKVKSPYVSRVLKQAKKKLSNIQQRVSCVLNEWIAKNTEKKIMVFF